MGYDARAFLSITVTLELSRLYAVKVSPLRRYRVTFTPILHRLYDVEPTRYERKGKSPWQRKHCRRCQDASQERFRALDAPVPKC